MIIFITNLRLTQYGKRNNTGTILPISPHEILSDSDYTNWGWS